MQMVPAPPGTRVDICYEELEEDEDPDDEERLIERWARHDPVLCFAWCYDIRQTDPGYADEDNSWPDAPTRM